MPLRSTDRVKKGRSTDAVLSKKHLYYTLMLFMSLCLDNGKQFRIQKYLGFLRHFLKENTYLVPIPHPQLHRVLQLYLLNFYLLRIQHQGYRKVMYSQRTKGRAVHTHLCLDQDPPRQFKTESALWVMAKLQLWLQNLSYIATPDVYTQMLLEK